MSCNGEDLLIRLSQQLLEKSRPFEEAVEKHFIWLEEVVLEFKRAFEDKGSHNLFPKTPSAKRARELETSKPRVDTIVEDGDDNDSESRSPAAKKSLVGNFENLTVPSPPTPPRRGRAASRVATLKLKENIKELSNLGAKKRRPSLTETESSAERKFGDKKRKISLREKSAIKEPIVTIDEKKKQTEVDEYVPSPVEDLSKKETQESSEKISRSEEQACVDGKISKYLPGVVLEDTGGGACTFATNKENEDSLKVRKESKGKENSSFQEEKNSTVVKEEPVVTPGLNDTECSPLKLDDSDTEEDVMVVDTAIASDTFVPDTLDKHVNSEEADAPKEKPISSPDIDREPPMGEVNSEVPHVNKQEPDIGVVLSKETKTGRSSASIGVTVPESQEEDTEAKDRIVPTEVESQDSDQTEGETKPERVVRTTRTKTRNVVPTKEVNEPVTKMRLTRSKLRHSPQAVETINITKDNVIVPSFDPPSSKSEEAEEPSVTEQDKAESMHPPEEPPKVRSTRTKRKESEGSNNRPVRSTRTKQKRLENESSGSASQDSAICSGDPTSEESETEGKVQTTAECSNNVSGSTTSVEVEVVVPVRRMTRSKVRQLANTAPVGIPSSPKSASKTNRGSFSRDCCTPKSDAASPHTPVRNRSPTKFEPRPFAPTKSKGTVKEMAVAYQKRIGSAKEAEEIPMQDIQVTQSSAKATRHSKGSVTKRESSTQRVAFRSLRKALAIARTAQTGKEDKSSSLLKPAGRARINQTKVTPTYSKDKILCVTAHRLENSSSSSKSGSSGRLNSKFRAVNTSVNMGKAVSSLAGGTPTEVRRHHNIASGIASFVTKVQPSKSTREEVEEKKQEELKKKREREEETCRKKDEILKWKVEEQKRKNEERMKKVQEAREARERKVLEAKEQKERERKLKAERFREEQLRKKQHLIMKKKAEEEARIQKLKELEEEELQRAEEQKRRVEEEKQLLIAALKKQKEELDKKKREIEMERIGREKLELERLKQREIERHALSEATNKPATSTLHKMPVLNETYTAEDDKENTNLNSTYTKPPNQELSSSSQVNNNSYLLTTQKKLVKKFNPENYDINDVGSGDSTDEEEKPKRKIPAWAQGVQLKKAVLNQFYYPPNVDLVFPPYLLDDPELSKIFTVKKKRFYNRTSSAVWSTPPSKLFS